MEIPVETFNPFASGRLNLDPNGVGFWRRLLILEQELFAPAILMIIVGPGVLGLLNLRVSANASCGEDLGLGTGHFIRCSGEVDTIRRDRP